MLMIVGGHSTIIGVLFVFKDFPFEKNTCIIWLGITNS